MRRGRFLLLVVVLLLVAGLAYARVSYWAYPPVTAHQPGQTRFFQPNNAGPYTIEGAIASIDWANGIIHWEDSVDSQMLMAVPHAPLNRCMRWAVYQTPEGDDIITGHGPARVRAEDTAASERRELYR